ncbi:TniQ family protein [Pelomonas sp. APW6]|uniref:TniQ family protein n=1 Tax=Roseateles subflavus TaxID=3053353 RepID=A0ABT7LNX5_9BURK|nr:TniQ family protein [Pelomonas sp. APW6]MDL5034579.1 TniQ family protein [Pelomonas sp. APW6]
MSAMAIELEPMALESAEGYLLRALTANGANVRDLLALRRGTARRHISPEDARLYESLTGVAASWFSCRIPTAVAGERWSELDLFGLRWRSDWTVRALYGQVCPECLADKHFARLEWDLMAFVACPVHRLLLVDRCAECGRSLMPHRPAIEVCRCGAFISRPQDNLQVADPLILAWCSWLSATVQAAIQQAPLPASPFEGLIGLSADGIYRLAICLGGGTRALRGAQLNSPGPWLATSAVDVVLQQGLAALAELECGQAPSIKLLPSSGDSLAEQAYRGVTLADRNAAATLRRRLRLPSRWRTSRKLLHRQGDLFEGWS